MRTIAAMACLAGLVVLATGTAALTGCQTWKGFGKDVGKLGTGIEGKSEATVAGPQGQEMTVVIPRSVTLRRGESQAIEVGIQRKGFVGGVSVTISMLPRGVQADVPPRPVEADIVGCVLKADADADMVSGQPVTIMVAGPNGMQTTRTFKLTVKQ